MEMEEAKPITHELKLLDLILDNIPDVLHATYGRAKDISHIPTHHLQAWDFVEHCLSGGLMVTD